MQIEKEERAEELHLANARFTRGELLVGEIVEHAQSRLCPLYRSVEVEPFAVDVIVLGIYAIEDLHCVEVCAVGDTTATFISNIRTYIAVKPTIATTTEEGFKPRTRVGRVKGTVCRGAKKFYTICRLEGTLIECSERGTLQEIFATSHQTDTHCENSTENFI